MHDRHAFHMLIDARTPAEYAIDHIPGAVNLPVLDNDERRIVGTLYKQVGAFEARRVGGGWWRLISRAICKARWQSTPKAGSPWCIAGAVVWAAAP